MYFLNTFLKFKNGGNINETIINVFTEGLKKTHYDRECLEAFAQGIKKSGDFCNVIRTLNYYPCDIAVIFGEVKNDKDKRKRMRLKAEVKGRHIHNGLIVIDTPVLMRPFDKKNVFRRIGIDSLFADIGDFSNKNSDSKRWEKLSKQFNIQPNFTKQRGDNVYILLQTFYDASLKGSERLRPKKYFTWVENVIKEIRQETDRKIVIRPHPNSLQNKDHLKLIEGFKKKISYNNIIFDYQQKSLFEVLDDAFVTITYNSGSAIDSLLYGIPTISYEEGSHAYSIVPHNSNNLENISFPDRDIFMQWLYDLSYVDWSLDEMKEGLPWKHLKPKILEYI